MMRCPHSQLPRGECAKGVVGGAKEDDELGGLVFLTGTRMRRGRGADARRAGRIHVTLTKDLRQMRSCLAHLTTHSLVR
jgi:hypothetical protein